MIDQFINFVIRPPRAEYNPDQYLWDTEFSLGGKKYKREDIELRNARGLALKCSHYLPTSFTEDTPLPCVVYCHGNSGCRADANEAAVILLPSNITLFTLDFSGSGLSEGDYVSLGSHEKDDLKVVVAYLRAKKEVSCIGLWGRSMGAVTSLLYGADDPSIAGMVLDSSFANLFDLMLELVDVYKIRLPKFTVKMALQYMRRVIQKKAKFDIMDLNPGQVAPKTFIPALFGHASGDIFIQPHHSDIIFKSYAGDKNIIKFEGDHNSPRPQFYYDSVSIFFYNVLHPPQVSSSSGKVDKYLNLGELKIGAGVDENLLYEIITGLRMVEVDAASSSSAPLPSVVRTKSVGELLTESGALLPNTNAAVASMLEQGDIVPEVNKNDGNDQPDAEDKAIGQSEGYHSYSSSNHESWGRCSSLGGTSDVEEPSTVDCHTNVNDNHQVKIKAPKTPLRKFKSIKSQGRPNRQDALIKKPKREKFEKLEAISQRLRSCICVNHKRQHSS